ncbi:hypothetical protein SISSUDRAFT_1130697, partial [Sistotremastrum suecicum HHB10207 ss-3]
MESDSEYGEGGKRELAYRDTLNGASISLLDLDHEWINPVHTYIEQILKSARWIASDPLTLEVESDIDPNAFTLPKSNSKKNPSKKKNPPPSRLVPACTLDPITPFVYNGEADLSKFTMWMTQVYVYIEDHHVPRKRKVFIAAKFCTGRALRYFTVHVLSGSSSDEWTLSTFFAGVFSACFPPRYFEDMKMTFYDRTQGDRSVSEFATEMKEMANILSEDVDEVLLAHKFWNGLHPAIREEMLNAEDYSEREPFDSLVEAAKAVERKAQLKNLGATAESLSASLRVWQRREQERMERERVDGSGADESPRVVHTTGYAV